MAVNSVGDAAVARTGDVFTILVSVDRDLAAELVGLLARAIPEGVGDTSSEVRQLLRDIEAAVHVSLSAGRPRRVRRPRPMVVETTEGKIVRQYPSVDMP